MDFNWTQWWRTILIINICMESSCGKIVFTTTPKSQAVQYGEDVLLNCNASDPLDDTKLLVYQWYYNSVPRPNGGSMFVNHSLLIADIKKEYLGNYTCGIKEIPKDDNAVIKTVMSPVALIIHAYIAGFMTNPTDVSSLEGKTITLSCVTGESAPPPQVSWEKDGIVFSGGSQYVTLFGNSGAPDLIVQYSMTLVLLAKPSDGGMYNCMAKNPTLGVEVRSLKVIVNVKHIDKAPYLDPGLYNSNILSPLNRPVLIDCPIGGYPIPKFEWIINGNKMLGDDRRAILQNGSLLISVLKMNDNGPYKCTGTNKLGSVTSPLMIVGATFSLNVSRKRTSGDTTVLELDFVREPYRKFVIAGRPMTIPCGPPKSYPPAVVTWYHNNKEVIYRTGEQSVFIVDPKNGIWDLFFSRVQKKDEGEYFCVATNNHSLPMTRTSKTGVVSVGGAPVFIQPPRNISVKKGDGVQLVCLVEGDPVPSVNWLQDGRDIVTNNQITLRRNNQELYITDTNKANEGTYTCRASNSYGIAQLSAYLKVMIPAVIIEAAKNRTVEVGTNVKISCKVEGDPVPAVVWYKDGAVLSVGGRILATDDGLVINSVVISDAGTYRCQVTNTAGQASTQMELSITALPFFVKTPTDQIVTITHSFNLTCVVDGNPEPAINWLFNGTNLFPSGLKMSDDKQIVQVVEASWQHVGRYTCVASSIEGAITWTASVSMQVPPTVYRIAGNGVVYNSKPLELTCLLDGVPYPSINWHHNERQMSASIDGRVNFPNKHRLYIKFTTPADTGKYKCIADNVIGKSESNLQVYIIESPLPPVLLIPEAVSSTAVKITWSPTTQNPHTPVTHYTLYYKERLELSYTQHPDNVLGTETSVVLQELTSGVEYLCFVTASNDAGEGARSDIKSVKTLDSGPSSPRRLSVKEIKSTAVTLEWEIPAVTNGQIKKYKVWFKTLGQNSKSEEFFTEPSVASPSYTVKNLEPYTVYEFYVQAATIARDKVMWGNLSETIQTRTSPSAPTGSPSNVFAFPVSPYIVQVSWNDVPIAQQHGPTQKFYVQYRPVSSHSVRSEVSVTAPIVTVNITHLIPWMYFSISVLAENAAGRGPASSEIVVRTHQTDPSSAPVGLQVDSIAMDTIHLQFKLPAKSTWNGDLSGYIVKYTKTAAITKTYTKTVYSVQNTALNISNLEPWTDYSFQVALFNGQARSYQGPFTPWTKAKTLGSVPGTVRDLNILSTPTSITLNWKVPDKPNGDIDSYHIDYYILGTVDQGNTEESSSNSSNTVLQNLVKRSATRIEISDSPRNNYVEMISKGYNGYSSELLKKGLDKDETECCRNILSEDTRELVKRDTSETKKSSENNDLPDWVTDDDKAEIILTCQVLIENNPAALQMFDSFLLNYTAMLRTRGKTEGSLTVLRNVLNGWADWLQNDTVIASNWSSTLQGVEEKLQIWIVESNASMYYTCYTLYNATQGKTENPVQVFMINTTTESAVLRNLKPATSYSVSLSAVNQYGKGDNLTFTATTKSLPPPPPPPPTETETSTLSTTTAATTTAAESMLAARGDNSGNIPIIVGGCLAGVFVVVMVILLGICLCVRRQPAATTPKTILTTESREGSVRSQSSLEEGESSRISTGQVFIQGNDAGYQATARSMSAAGDYGQMKESFSIPANISQHPAVITRGSHSASGINNPAFVSGHGSSYHDYETESVALSLALSAEEVYSQASNTLKRNRMRSESAAAIAVMRNSALPQLGIQTEDTDSLIRNDSVVVYTERTAL